MPESQSKTTRRLKLVPKTLAQVHAQIAAMTPDQRALMSRDWLAQLASPNVDTWTLGFDIVDRATDAVVGTCGFKGPPGIDGIVEIAYGVNPDQQGKGYATEAAEWLLAYAFGDGQVRRVCAHTLSTTNASARVLTKCGFISVGEIVDPEDGPVWRWEK